MEDTGHEPVYSYGHDWNDYDKWGYNSIKADYQRSFKRNKKEMLTLSYQYGYSPQNTNNYSEIMDKQGDAVSLEYLENIRGGGLGGYVGYNPSAKTSLSVNVSLYYLNLWVDKKYETLLPGLDNQGVSGGIYANFSQKPNRRWHINLSGF